VRVSDARVIRSHVVHTHPVTAHPAWAIAREVVRYAILLAVAAVMGFPLVWLIVTSLKTQNAVFGAFLPQTVTWSNFSRVWNEISFPKHFKTSALVTLGTVILVVAVATPASYAFARFRFRGREALFFGFLACMMVPAITLLIPMFLFLKQLTLEGQAIGLVLAYTGPAVAFSMFIMRAFFRTLPADLGDSARIDGASEWGVFWRIYLPLARPGIATVVIMQFMFTWNEFMFATTYILDPEKQTLQPSLFTAIGRYSTDWPALSAGLLLSIAPIVVVYLAMQRHFERGIVAGAVKG
jgi:ABC-type glycerol-3-phosphate transport system permease component